MREYHGKTRTHVWWCWQQMRCRCKNSNRPDFKHYGGKGVTVCKRWESFSAFYADMGEPPSPAHSIDRVDCGGNYEPSNCRWATQKQQVRNSSKAKTIVHDGEALCITEWAERFNIAPATLMSRLKRGMSIPAATAARNLTRKDAAMIVVDGTTIRLVDACRLYGIRCRTVVERIKRGWSHSRALKTRVTPSRRGIRNRISQPETAAS